MTLNKEQSFLVHEFIRKHSEERVWETQDQLYKLISETLAASTSQVEEEDYWDEQLTTTLRSKIEGNQRLIA